MESSQESWKVYVIKRKIKNKQATVKLKGVHEFNSEAFALEYIAKHKRIFPKLYYKLIDNNVRDMRDQLPGILSDNNRPHLLRS